jgi:hypothetical protein
MSSVVGFDRKIKREWLDAIADHAAQDTDPVRLRQFLHGLLAKDHPGSEARGKTITVLMRVWALVPEGHRSLRQEAFGLLQTVPAADRLLLHWGMLELAYPLFRDTATAIGRLSKLQEEFTLAQIERRLVDTWGQRSTVKRAFQRIVRSMVEWHVLADAKTPGHFVITTTLSTRCKPLQLWFLKASHVAVDGEMVEAGQLLAMPSSFPFKLSVRMADLRRCKEFEVHRQGVDLDLVSVARLR